MAEGTTALYFAYGANLDSCGMAERCPRSAPLGRAWLDHHRFFIMADGYASVRPEPDAVVHGFLWDLTEDDVAELDRYEEVDAGLYDKRIMPVMSPNGPGQALVYVGRGGTVGQARPGYMEAVIASVERLGFPAPYRRELEHWLPTRQAGS